MLIVVKNRQWLAEFFLGSQRIAQIHFGRQYLYNKKLTMHIYISKKETLVYNIIRYIFISIQNLKKQSVSKQAQLRAVVDRLDRLNSTSE